VSLGHGVRAEEPATPPSGAAPSAPSTEAASPVSSPGSTGKPVLLDEVVVRLPRAQPAGDPTASATIVQAGRFAGEAKDVAQLVATAPGVAVNEYGGLGQLATVSIRGSMASGVLVLLDGIPLEAGSGSGTDLASIPRHWVEWIEVVRGAEGAHYGAGALAGVVNVVTRRPEAGSWSAEAGWGSFGTGTLALDGGAVAGPWTVFAAASLDGSQGDFSYRFNPRPSVGGSALVDLRRAHNTALRGGLLLKAARPLGDWRLDVLAQASGGRRDLPGWPYHLTPDDGQRDGRALVAARATGPGPAAGLDLGLRVQARLDELDLRLGAPGFAVQRGAAAGACAEALLLHPLGRARLALSGDVEGLTSEGLGGRRGRGALALSVSDDLLLSGGRLRLAPALRAEAVGPFRGLSAKLGGSLALPADLSLRASAGRTFRAPSFAELHLVQGLASPNPELSAETGVTGDVGLAYQGALGLASLGGFAQLYRDLILYLDTGTSLKPFNAGKALVSGLEAELASAPAPALLGLSAAASYTLLLTEQLRGDASVLGRALPNRARHRLFARLGLSPGPVELHAEVQVVGRQYLDAANTRATPAALLVGAGASLRLARQPELRLHLELKNLADDRTLQDGLANPLPGRMVMITLRAGA
jgi:iron complex outermembrane receptor protein